MAELKENEEKLMNQNIEDQPPPTSAYSKKRQVIFYQQKLPKLNITSKILATFCATLGCLLNGAAIGYTGPALPSLGNITGRSNDGYDLYGGDMIVSPQQASWISMESKMLEIQVLLMILL